jgi:hypothetical protein
MDIFVFHQTPTAFDLSSGMFINNYTQATWIEKFVDPSVFVIEAPLDSKIREEMPIGSLVSHIDSDVVCRVENHEIVIDEDSDITDKIVISGSAFETFLDNRIVGSNRVWNFVNSEVPSYAISGGYAYAQARQLITDHIDAQDLIDDADALPLVNVWLHPLINPSLGPLNQPGESIFERSYLYEEVKKLLALDNLGLETRRPRYGVNLDDGIDSPTRYEPNGLTLCVYPAYDRTKKITFSHTMGDVKKADYLFSDKFLKTSCYVVSQYFSVMTHLPGYSGYARRVMVLDASDLDAQYTEIPVGSERTRIMSAMESRGQAILAMRNSVSISNVELGDKNLTHVYRQDYKLGDYVSVYGDYQASTVRQITEHVEIQDQNGYSAYPTLSEPPLGGYYVPPQYFT